MEKLKERINKGAHNLIYPFDEIPDPGKMLKVADGVYWVRMSLGIQRERPVGVMSQI